MLEIVILDILLFTPILIPGAIELFHRSQTLLGRMRAARATAA